MKWQNIALNWEKWWLLEGYLTRYQQTQLWTRQVLEAIILEQDYKLLYVPAAIVHNKGPENFSDFVTKTQNSSRTFMV